MGGLFGGIGNIFTGGQTGSGFPIDGGSDADVGVVGSILGPNGLGLTGTASNSIQQVTQDPVTQLINMLRFNSASGALNGTGVFGDIYNQLTSINPQAAVAYGQNLFNQILSPRITGDYSLMGLARSGANEEAQAKGAAQMSLPLAQQGLQLQQQGLLGQLGTMSSILNALPYNSQPTVRQRGSGDTGLLTSLLGGSGAGGAASAAIGLMG